MMRFIFVMLTLLLTGCSGHEERLQTASEIAQPAGLQAESVVAGPFSRQRQRY